MQKLITVKKRSSLSFEKRVSRVPAGKASPKASGRIREMLGPNTDYHQYVVVRIDLF